MKFILAITEFEKSKFHAYLVFHRKSKFSGQIEVFWRIQSQLILHSPLHPTINFQVSNLCKSKIFVILSDEKLLKIVTVKFSLLSKPYYKSHHGPSYNTQLSLTYKLYCVNVNNRMLAPHKLYKIWSYHRRNGLCL